MDTATITGESEEDTKILIYGTLKNGFPDHFILGDNYEFLGEGTTVEKWPLVIYTKFNIPYVLDLKGEGQQIKGEVYEVDSDTLESLDILEQHPDMYCRQLILVQLENSEIIECYCYILSNFKPDILKEEFLSEYELNPYRPYVTPPLRPAGSLDYLMKVIKQ